MSKDAAILARVLAAVGGECRICRCAGDSCSLETGDRCFWTDNLRTLCSNRRCVTADAIKRRRERREAGKRRVSKTKRRVA
jgi:hypothetical protein